MRVPYARLHLCRDHFIKYEVSRVEKTIERYGLFKRDSKLLLAISGGKDSVMLLDVLYTIRGRLNIKIGVLHIDLGINGYSEESRRVVLSICGMLNMTPIILPLRECLGYSVKEIAEKTGRKYCSVCGVIKRYITNTVGIYLGVDAVVTGHNLDDLTAYCLKEILRGNLKGALRLHPKLKGEGKLAARVKPLAEVSERETAMYVVLKGLPFMMGECSLAPPRTIEVKSREFLSSIEANHPSIKVSFYRGIIGGLEVGDTVKLRECQVCGFPSLASRCSFCRLILRATGSEKPIRVLHERIKNLQVNLT